MELLELARGRPPFQTRLARACAEGLPPADFARCEGLDEAVTVARKLLRLQVRAKTSSNNER